MQSPSNGNGLAHSMNQKASVAGKLEVRAEEKNLAKRGSLVEVRNLDFVGEVEI